MQYIWGTDRILSTENVCITVILNYVEQLRVSVIMAFIYVLVIVFPTESSRLLINLLIDSSKPENTMIIIYAAKTHLNVLSSHMKRIQ